jgi:hypothetical protein
MLPCNKEAPMTAAHDLWTATLERWQGMLPPLANPTVVDPAQAIRIAAGIQRTALDTWRESCEQAHELGVKALEWNLEQAERMAQAARDSAS